MTSTHTMPALRSLQVFEAAARCGSFTAAGKALGITQSAVSRQVSDLEAILGVMLFVRNGARLTVTPIGKKLAGHLAEAFAGIQTAVADVRGLNKTVTLSMLPSVATRWFAARLDHFLAQNHDIDLRITASRHLVDFIAEGIDAAIRYGPKPSNNLEAIKLYTENVIPVCSPSYATKLGLKAPEDIYRATLLWGDIAEDWHAWFKVADLCHPPSAGPRLGDDSAILQAAVEGQGIALGRSLLIKDDIAIKRLVAPFSISLCASYAYWFVYPKGLSSLNTIDAVRVWLVEQFNEHN